MNEQEKQNRVLKELYDKYPELEKLQLEAYTREVEKRLSNANKYVKASIIVGVALYIADYDLGKNKYTQTRISMILKSIGYNAGEAVIRKYAKIYLGVDDLYILDKRIKRVSEIRDRLYNKWFECYNDCYNKSSYYNTKCGLCSFKKFCEIKYKESEK
ncbi:hypothetical protein ES708_04059 [subsurface metagenome]